MSETTVFHTPIDSGKDGLHARFAIRSYADIFRQSDVEAGLVSIAAYNVQTMLGELTKRFELDIDVDLERYPQYMQVHMHGFDMHMAPEMLQELLFTSQSIRRILKNCGAELHVAEQPGAGSSVLITILGSRVAGAITQANIDAVVERLSATSDDILSEEVQLCDKTTLGLLQAGHGASYNDDSFIPKPGMGDGAAFILEELHETRALLKQLAQQADRYEELYATFREGIADIQSVFSSVANNGIESVAHINNIVKESSLKLSAMNTQMDAIMEKAKATYNFDLEIEEFPIGEVFSAMQALYQPVAAAKNIELRFEADDSLPLFNTDKKKIARALYYLLDNAVRYTDSGSVTVLASIASHKGDVVITVVDTGIGISSGSHQQLLADIHRNDTAESVRHSGLSVTQALVQSIGGQISVDSEVGKGSKFMVRIPPNYPASIIAQSGSIVEPAILEPMEEEAGGEKPSVLIVEDDEATQFLMRKILHDDYTCYGAASANEAYAVLAKHEIRFIYMDIALRGSIDGIELTRQLRASKEWRDVPIIALTSFTHDSTRGEALCAGCDDYLTKPINKVEVLGKIEEYMRAPRIETTPFTT